MLGRIEKPHAQGGREGWFCPGKWKEHPRRGALWVEPKKISKKAAHT